MNVHSRNFRCIHRHAVLREKGNITTLVVISLAVLLGFVALSVGTGDVLSLRERMQMAADSAAMAGALAVRDNPTTIDQETLTTIGRASAQKNGFEDGSNGVTVTVTKSPETGYSRDYSWDPSAVGVTITQPREMIFYKVLSPFYTSSQVGTRAVASTGTGGNGLLVVLKKSANAINMLGNSSLIANGLIQVNSTSTNAIRTVGSGYIKSKALGVGAPSITEQFNYYNNDGGTPRIIYNMPPADDPYQNLIPPTVGACNWTNCKIENPGKENPTGRTNCPTGATLSPGVYCSTTKGKPAIDIAGNTVNVSLSGTYILNGGGMSVDNQATVTGSNVMIYNTGTDDAGGYPYGNINFNRNGTTIDLTGLPNTDDEPYKSFVFFQDRYNYCTLNVKNSPTVKLNGIVYITKEQKPGETWSYDQDCGDAKTGVAESDYSISIEAGAGTNATAYTIFVIWSAQFGGGGTFYMNSSYGPGGSPLEHISLSE